MMILIILCRVVLLLRSLHLHALIPRKVKNPWKNPPGKSPVTMMMMNQFAQNTNLWGELMMTTTMMIICQMVMGMMGFPEISNLRMWWKTRGTCYLNNEETIIKAFEEEWGLVLTQSLSFSQVVLEIVVDNYMFIIQLCVCACVLWGCWSSAPICGALWWWNAVLHGFRKCDVSWRS